MNVPVSVYAEMTPNPTTMKFVANKYLLATGDSVEFVKRQDAVGYSPLAEALFNFPFVKAVFIAANFVTVTKTDNVPWDFITMELREFIRDFIAEGKEVLIQMPV
ncbi:MAG: NifU N-terminal domain-containing protein, partial [Flavobacteriales bacterium]